MLITPLRLRIRFTQSRAVAHDVVDLVQHDLKPVGAIREKEIADEFVPVRVVEAAVQRAVEHAQAARGACDHGVERGVEIGGALQSCMPGCCVVVHARLSFSSAASRANSI